MTVPLTVTSWDKFTGHDVALWHHDRPVAVVHVKEQFGYDKAHEARNVFRTEDVAHPGVAALMIPGIAGSAEGTVTRDLGWNGGDRFGVAMSAHTTFTQGPTARIVVTGPKDIVDRLNKELNAALATPEAKARLAEIGGTAIEGSAESLARITTSLGPAILSMPTWP